MSPQPASMSAQASERAHHLTSTPCGVACCRRCRSPRAGHTTPTRCSPPSPCTTRSRQPPCPAGHQARQQRQALVQAHRTASARTQATATATIRGPRQGTMAACARAPCSPKRQALRVHAWLRPSSRLSRRPLQHPSMQHMHTVVWPAPHVTTSPWYSLLGSMWHMPVSSCGAGQGRLEAARGGPGAASGVCGESACNPSPQGCTWPLGLGRKHQASRSSAPAGLGKRQSCGGGTACWAAGHHHTHCA